jgi:uncharacterized protein YigA (DUF484 family)
MTTDNQVNKQREKNESLRAEIADLNRQREESEAAQANTALLARLKQEHDALVTERDQAKRLAKVAADAAKAKAGDEETESVPVVVGTNMQTPPAEVSANDTPKEK